MDGRKSVIARFRDRFVRRSTLVLFLSVAFALIVFPGAPREHHPIKTVKTTMVVASGDQSSSVNPPPLPAAAIVAGSGLPTSVLVSKPPGLNKIQHFIFILQENRSFDSYFGTYPGADGLPSDVCLAGPSGTPCVAPHRDLKTVDFDGPHLSADAQTAINGGQMNGFLTAAYAKAARNKLPACGTAKTPCKPGQDPRDVMAWHDYRDIPNYWNYAHLYVLQDHMFSSAASNTLPNRLYMLAGQSVTADSTATATKTLTYRIPAITDTLTADDVSWRYYVANGDQVDARGEVIPNALQIAEGPLHFSLLNPLPALLGMQSDSAQRGRVVSTEQFYQDARNGTLPAVSWVVPSLALSEHPPKDIRVGMSYVTGLVDAVMASPDWNSTAIFISYDEWGGFYDHVPPPRIDRYGLGMRVPGLVISPYARQGYVDHTVYSTASWLRLIEERFNLRPLTLRDAWANDMRADFDFTQLPRAPIGLSPTIHGTAYPVAKQTIQH